MNLACATRWRENAAGCFASVSSKERGIACGRADSRAPGWVVMRYRGSVVPWIDATALSRSPRSSCSNTSTSSSKPPIARNTDVGATRVGPARPAPPLPSRKKSLPFSSASTGTTVWRSCPSTPTMVTADITAIGRGNVDCSAASMDRATMSSRSTSSSSRNVIHAPFADCRPRFLATETPPACARRITRTRASSSCGSNGGTDPSSTTTTSTSTVCASALATRAPRELGAVVRGDHDGGRAGSVAHAPGSIVLPRRLVQPSRHARALSLRWAHARPGLLNRFAIGFMKPVTSVTRNALVVVLRARRIQIRLRRL